LKGLHRGKQGSANFSSITNGGTATVVALAPSQRSTQTGFIQSIYLNSYCNFIIQANPETKKPAASIGKQPVKDDQ